MSRTVIAREDANETINLRPENESSMSSLQVAPNEQSSIFKESDVKDNLNNKSCQEIVIQYQNIGESAVASDGDYTSNSIIKETKVISKQDYEIQAPLHMRIDAIIEDRKSRKHGLQWPLKWKQVFLIVYLLATEVLTIYLNIQNLNIILLITQSILLVILVYWGTLATIIDSTDPLIYYQRFYAQDKAYLKQLNKMFPYQCGVCDMATHPHTKHCKECNRCCHKFDHHCQWLNNCIGDENYTHFIQSCIWLCVYLIAFTVIITLEMENHKFVIAFMVFNFLIFCQGLYLLVLHLYLTYKGLTMFEYICWQRQLEENKDSTNQEKQKIESELRRFKRDYSKNYNKILQE